MAMLKDAIFQKIRDFQHVSFVELNKIEGFHGDLALHASDQPNIIFWTNVSQEAVDALSELTKENKITIAPCTPLIYFADGLAPVLPIAKPRQRVFKKPTWLPLVFNPVRA